MKPTLTKLTVCQCTYEINPCIHRLNSKTSIYSLYFDIFVYHCQMPEKIIVITTKTTLLKLLDIFSDKCFLYFPVIGTGHGNFDFLSALDGRDMPYKVSNFEREIFLHTLSQRNCFVENYWGENASLKLHIGFSHLYYYGSL